MKLSEEERTESGRVLAELVARRTEVSEDKAKDVAGYNLRLKELDHRIARLAWSVNTGLMPEEDRQLELGEDAK